MRQKLFALFFGIGALALAEQLSSSEQLRQEFISILNQQLFKLVVAGTADNPQVPPDEIDKGVHDLTVKAAQAYAALIALPEGEAHRLLTIGPDDRANMAAMHRDIELWKGVERPMPTLCKQMQDEVTNGEIKSGLELELTRRISEFHLRQLGVL
jgi:hypothetical protein